MTKSISSTAIEVRDRAQGRYVTPPTFCAACRQRGKTWDGADPKCAFEADAPFSMENWNCATAGLIRDICEDRAGHERVHHHETIYDQHYATIDLTDIELPSCKEYAVVLCVVWYKHRGKTEQMYLLFDDQPAKRPTEADCLAIVEAIKSA